MGYGYSHWEIAWLYDIGLIHLVSVLHLNLKAMVLWAFILI